MLQLICIILLNLTLAVLLKDNPAFKVLSLILTLILMVIVLAGWPEITMPTASSYPLTDTSSAETDLLNIIAETNKKYGE